MKPSRAFVRIARKGCCAAFVKVNGKLCYLWRAVDHEGEVLEAVVTAKRDKAAALKFLKRIMKKYGRPLSVVTDGLCSYPAAMKEIGIADRKEVGRRLNNRAENSHQPFRRRERAMQRTRGVADAVCLGLDDAAAGHAFGPSPQEHFADEKTSELSGIDGHLCPVQHARERQCRADFIPFAQPNARARVRVRTGRQSIGSRGPPCRHDAHRIGRPAVIGEDEFRNPEVEEAAHDPTGEALRHAIPHRHHLDDENTA